VAGVCASDPLGRLGLPGGRAMHFASRLHRSCCPPGILPLRQPARQHARVHLQVVEVFKESKQLRQIAVDPFMPVPAKLALVKNLFSDSPATEITKRLFGEPRLAWPGQPPAWQHEGGTLQRPALRQPIRVASWRGSCRGPGRSRRAPPAVCMPPCCAAESLAESNALAATLAVATHYDQLMLAQKKEVHCNFITAQASGDTQRGRLGSPAASPAPARLRAPGAARPAPSWPGRAARLGFTLHPSSPAASGQDGACGAAQAGRGVRRARLQAGHAGEGAGERGEGTRLPWPPHRRSHAAGGCGMGDAVSHACAGCTSGCGAGGRELARVLGWTRRGRPLCSCRWTPSCWAASSWSLRTGWWT